MSETVVIRESVGENIKMLLISICGTAALVWCIQWDEIGKDVIGFYLAKILSFILLPFVFMLILATVWKIIKSPPLLIIKESGFEFAYRFNRIFSMDWGSVEDISLVDIKTSKYGVTINTLTCLCVSAKNRDKHIASLSKPAKLVAAISNWFGYPQVAQIPMNMVKNYTAGEVLAIMNKYWKYWKQNNQQ